MTHRCTFKVAIVGLGRVGTTAAYALLLRGLPTDLVLYARDRDKAEGEKLDFEHSLPFMEGTNIIATNDFADLAGCDVIIYTAGAAQEPGETRLDLTKKNLAIVDSTLPHILEAAPRAVIIMVSNPVDLMTYRANQIAGWPPGRIFGSGTLLDTARFRFHLSEALDVNSRSIHTYILGEHGDTSFPAIASATIGGQLLTEFPGYSETVLKNALEQTRQAAYRIIEGKGATYYAIGTALTHLVRSVHRDSRSVVPASVPLHDYYGHSGVALSIPCVVGKTGVSEPLRITLSETEQSALAASVAALKQYL